MARSGSAPHPVIHEILAETYGIMVYQEQVMQIAQTMAGYSLGSADLLRRAMGKKIAAEMEAQRNIFTEGAIKRGINPAKATEVFDLMAKFADYGFNKSHAAAYALVAYQTAWLKANHPEVFIAACMSLAINNTDRLAALKQEAERGVIKILPPDINRSGADFSVERHGGWAAGDPLRAGGGEEGWLRGHGIGRRRPRRCDRSPTSRISPPGSIRARSTACRSKTWSAPAHSTGWTATGRGCSPGPKRFCGEPRRIRRKRKAARSGCSAARPANRNRCACRMCPTGRRWSGWRSRRRPIGFHLTAHPLDTYAQALKRLGVTQSIHVEARAAAGVSRVKIAGTVVATKERITRTGSRMAWVRISDAAGSVEVTCFSEVLNRSREILASGSNVLVTAELKTEGEAVRVTAMDVVPLDQAAAAAGASIRIWLRETAAVPHIRDVLGRESGGRGRVTLVPQYRQRPGRGDRPAGRLQRDAAAGTGAEVAAGCGSG